MATETGPELVEVELVEVDGEVHEISQTETNHHDGYETKSVVPDEIKHTSYRVTQDRNTLTERRHQNIEIITWTTTGIRIDFASGIGVTPANVTPIKLSFAQALILEGRLKALLDQMLSNDPGIMEET
jgi:hypothetical protein